MVPSPEVSQIMLFLTKFANDWGPVVLGNDATDPISLEVSEQLQYVFHKDSNDSEASEEGRS